jgi:hypothetical protein
MTREMLCLLFGFLLGIVFASMLFGVIFLGTKLEASTDIADDEQ